MFKQRGWVPLGAVAIILVMCPPGHADLLISTQVLGGGLYQYNLTVVDTGVVNPLTGMPEPVSGLNIIDANTLFGLDSSSVIMAPQSIGGNPAASWDFFPPFPPLVSELNFFSLDPTGDVPIGGSLGGFLFQSTTAPSTLPAGGLTYGIDYDFIVSSGVQAVAVPEPATWIPTMVVIITFLTLSRRGIRRGANGPDRHQASGRPQFDRGSILEQMDGSTARS